MTRLERSRPGKGCRKIAGSGPRVQALVARKQASRGTACRRSRKSFAGPCPAKELGEIGPFAADAVYVPSASGRRFWLGLVAASEVLIHGSAIKNPHKLRKISKLR